MSYGNDQYGQSANYGGGNDPYGQGGTDPYAQNQGGGYDQGQGYGQDQGYGQAGGGYPEPAGYVGDQGAYAGGAPARPSIKFPQALPLALKNYATFHGRASRSEYWFFFLATLLISVILNLLASILGGTDPTTMQPANGAVTAVQGLSGLIGLALLVPNLAVTARRLHDTNRSGWMMLLGLIPLVGWIILLVLLAGESKPEGARFDNPDGSQPKLP